VIENPGLIPEVVNERVKASVVVQHHVPLRDDKGVRIVARRKPGGADVTWRVTFDPGLDPQDPDLRARGRRRAGRVAHHDGAVTARCPRKPPVAH
jgi:hypothetical protein